MMIDVVVIVAMLIPFAFKSKLAYVYWIVLSSLYIAYKAWRWKV